MGFARDTIVPSFASLLRACAQPPGSGDLFPRSSHQLQRPVHHGRAAPKYTRTLCPSRNRG
jgi:hypothetical protein